MNHGTSQTLVLINESSVQMIPEPDERKYIIACFLSRVLGLHPPQPPPKKTNKKNNINFTEYYPNLGRVMSLGTFLFLFSKMVESQLVAGSILSNLNQYGEIIVTTCVDVKGSKKM